jgi:tetratricopeptide (TPR) repeat protein
VDKEALFDQGLTAGMRGDTDKAIESFQEVVKLDPGYVPAMYQLGKAYLKRGDFAAAVDALTRAAGKRPDQASIHVDLGQAYLCLNELDKAQAAFTKALAFEDGNTRAITGLAQVHYKNQDWQRAASHAKLVLLNSPMNFAALYLLGSASYNLGNPMEAHEAFQKAMDIVNQFLNLKPEQVEGHFLLGEIYFYEGMLDKALENYELAEKHAGDALSFAAFGLAFSRTELQGKLGVCYRQLGQVDKARQMGEKILAREPESTAGQELVQEKAAQD